MSDLWRVSFEPMGVSAEVGAGASVMDAARLAGVALPSVCGGEGTCGRCRVAVTGGELSEPAEADRRALSRLELDSGYRLACRTRPEGEVTVRVPRASLIGEQRLQIGGTWLDVNAGTRSDREPDDLIWLIKTVQEVTEVPLCLDSANPEALRAAIGETARTPLINSISGEPWRLETVLPLAASRGCPVIALALDDKGIPGDSDGRLAIIRRLIQATRDAGIGDDRVYLDPLVMTISTDTSAALAAVATIRAIREEFPDAHITSGLSNISFGLPTRGLVNRTFLTLAMAAGQDTAICDPLDKQLRATMIAAELLLGQDRHCRAYTKFFRAGLLG